MDGQKGGVIWVTGYPGAGKTSIASLVCQILKDKGRNSILLDGDHLRELFGQKWGRGKDERVSLATTYLKTSNYLASQGYTVVLSAVGMFNAVEQWANDHIERYLQVYLDVPPHQRRQRASMQGKRVYSEQKDDRATYDKLLCVSASYDNSDGADRFKIASDIVEKWMTTRSRNIETGRRPYWAEFYKKGNSVLEPSPFAQYVASLLPDDGSVVEIGCGERA